MRGFLVFGMMTVLAAPVFAENWPNWRGPDYNGVASGTGYPAKWDAKTNVAWKLELPGKGSSTPVVWGEQIFLTCGVDGQNGLMALNRQGKELWRLTYGAERVGKNKKASGSNPSCVVDGNHVFAYFKNSDLACATLGGERVWQVNLQEKFGADTLWWDLGTSPVLTSAHCVVAVMQTGNSYLVALDKATGKVAWKVDRNLEAPEEAAQSYSTPVVARESGEEQLIVVGADHVTTHRASDGKEIWRVGGLNPTNHKYFRSIASAVSTEGLVIAPYARGETITAIRKGGAGDVTKSHVAWTKSGKFSDVPTPTIAGNKLYVLNDKGSVSCLKLETGDEVWTGQLEKSRHGFSASPILAEGKIYLLREDGKMFILAQGDEFKILSESGLDGSQVVASPVLIDGMILVRTETSLFCIGTPANTAKSVSK